MDIRIVETLPMSGALADPFYKLDGTKESVSLDWSYVNNSFDLIDRNIDYSRLPMQLNSQLVKKVFLTYNSISCQTKEIIETVVLESQNVSEINQSPGYNNSNEWLYQPSNFRLPAELQSGLSNDLLTWPYPWNEGVTLTKTFLNSQSNTVQPLYTAYYRRPTMTSFELANVDGGKVCVDGWYTSYVIAVKKHSALNANPLIVTSTPTNIIVLNDSDNAFYKNITGTCLPANTTFVTLPSGIVEDASLPQHDTVNWTSVLVFQDWLDFLKSNYYNTFGAGGMNQNNNFTGTLAPNIMSGYSATLNQSSTSAANIGLIGNPSPSNIVTSNDQCFYIESNHLATPELNAAILLELKKLCGCCHENKFNFSHLEDWVKLTGKRQSSVIAFREDSFKEAQSIIMSCRPLCGVSLRDNNDCNFKYNKSCC